MPIEFRCTRCEKLLSVPDASAGGKARCPQCETIIVVPQPGVSATSPTPPIANPYSEANAPPIPPGQNPYSTPTHAPTKAPPKSGKFEPTAVQAGNVIDFAWETWKNNLGILLGITLLIMGINIGFSFIGEIATGIFVQQRAQELAIMSSVGLSLISNVIQIFLGIGQTMIVLKLLRRQPAEFSELFSGGRLFLPVLGTSILFGIAIMMGILLLIVPAILLGLYFWPYYYVIVDEKSKAMDSFGVAKSIGALNVGTTFVLWLASMGIGLLGLLACGVGLIFAVPLISTIWCAAYLMMSGQIRFSHQPMK